ncbi:unnamed protein product [Diabrotica balteata]|uniref:Uncharacterized protein n=1 Tax=Diabrotica balteata TaxID=107213 RepID=A0A9N9T4S4_DIABA|nr:unnamed protein product [Diabrotica balteata]
MPGNENVLPENSISLNETPTISNENTYNDLCLPSTSNIVNMDQRKNYYILSPIRSNKSNIDDSDADPNFDVSPDKLLRQNYYTTVHLSLQFRILEIMEKRKEKKSPKPENWKMNVAK